MTVRMRSTKSHTGNRRAHHSISVPRFSICKECKAKCTSHRVCGNCGKYNGRQIIDMEAKIMKKAERMKKKRKEIGLEPEKAVAEEKKF